MPTQSSVHAAIDALTAAVFVGYPVYYGNTTVPKQTADYLKQNVIFTSDNQFELGNTTSGRVRGKVLFTFHNKRGTGSSVRNTWNQLISTWFRSKVVGGAVLQNALASVAGENENWAITVVEVPFYFDS